MDFSEKMDVFEFRGSGEIHPKAMKKSTNVTMRRLSLSRGGDLGEVPDGCKKLLSLQSARKAISGTQATVSPVSQSTCGGACLLATHFQTQTSKDKIMIRTIRMS